MVVVIVTERIPFVPQQISYIRLEIIGGKNRQKVQINTISLWKTGSFDFLFFFCRYV